MRTNESHVVRSVQYIDYTHLLREKKEMLDEKKQSNFPGILMDRFAIKSLQGEVLWQLRQGLNITWAHLLLSHPIDNTITLFVADTSMVIGPQ